jgi:hypothetical protein
MSLAAERRSVLVVTAVAMLAAFGLSALYTILFAPKLPTASFWSGLAWLLLVSLTVWGIYLLRIRQRLDARRRGGDQNRLRSAAPAVALGFGAVSILWLFIAHLGGADGFLPRLHWVLQPLLLAGAFWVILRRFMHYRGSPMTERSSNFNQNSDKRGQLINDLASVRDSSWFDQFNRGTPGHRLRAALRWWEEELGNSVPDQPAILQQDAVGLYLDEARRQLAYIQALTDRGDAMEEETVLDAERRVLECIDRASSLQRRFNG